MNLYKRILSVFLVIATIFCLCVPVFAIGEPTTGFWQWIPGFTPGGQFDGDGGFRGDEASTAYNSYVSTIQNSLGSTSIGSNGYYFAIPAASVEPGGSSTVWSGKEMKAGHPSTFSAIPDRSGVPVLFKRLSTFLPIDGYYTFVCQYSVRNLAYDTVNSTKMERVAHVAGSYNSTIFTRFTVINGKDFCSATVGMYFFIEPYTFDFASHYGEYAAPSTRVGVLQGDYIGPDGTKYENTYIVNETNNTVYNPVTGETYNISEWNYDYSTRTYNVVIDNSQTINITYGDEYVTINQGDTVTNIYYGGGTETPPPDPSTCQHTYADTVTTAPTCTMPGEKTSTCSKCSKSTIAPIPAKGHTWTVRETVQTTYDEAGKLLTEGYTIYKCSVCGEEYKSTGTTGPPPSGGGNIPGESTGVFSGVLGLLLDFISFFWNMFTGFIDQGIKGFLKSLTDATSDVFGILNPFSWAYS